MQRIRYPDCLTCGELYSLSVMQTSLVFDQDPVDMRYLWPEAVLHDPSGNKIKLYWAGENRLNPPWRVELHA